jgi:Zn-dependent peptidase ImmA (M78 family)
LGNFFDRGVHYEVAGQIDQTRRVVSISEQFAPNVRNFTTAHELGHYLLHTQPILHRDRPLDGRPPEETLPPEERQANKFASYFLMPAKLVRKSFSRVFLTERFRATQESAVALGERSVSALLARCKSPRDLSCLLASAGFYHVAAFRSLAEQFNVSVEAMAIRLEELELIEWPYTS